MEKDDADATTEHRAKVTGALQRVVEEDRALLDRLRDMPDHVGLPGDGGTPDGVDQAHK